MPRLMALDDVVYPILLFPSQMLRPWGVYVGLYVIFLVFGYDSFGRSVGQFERWVVARREC